MDNRVTDLTYLKNLSNNDINFVREMVEAFIDLAPNMLKKMSFYADEENWRALGESAHQMKPTLTFMGMQDMKNVVLEIERICENESDITLVQRLIEDLQDTCEMAYQELSFNLEQDLIQ
ncbi:MAG: Hpt domain-containing protein [Candidatus Cyclobacteriaceae bacterium M3_2C_046]